MNYNSILNIDTSIIANTLNLSRHVLTSAETNLLSKGLTFVPSPRRIEKQCLLTASNNFLRLVKLRYFFKNRPSLTRLKYLPKSTFNPPIQFMSNNIKVFANQLTDFSSNFKINNIISNLSLVERKALSSLKEDKEIVIKKADKGGVTVILNKSDYITQTLALLGDVTQYQETEIDDNMTTIALLKPELFDLLNKGFINKKQFKFFDKSMLDSKPRRLYCLPKIHKPVESWITNNIPPGRPIISDINSVTYEISKFISDHLKLLSCQHASYIRDTYDLLEKLKDLKIPKNASLVTLDVKSLYPSIPIIEGLEAVSNFMELYPDNKRPDSNILKLLEICLTRNYFIFNSNTYIQKSGAAMGHGYCVHYANIFMANWELKAIDTYHLKPSVWFRFIDDIFSIWTFTRIQFDLFFTHLNSINPSIKLTFEFNDSSINFLDVTFYKGPRFNSNSILDTKVYFKPTNKHQLLHHSSFHPKHIFKSVVKSQVLRFSRICNNTEDFDNTTSILFQSLYKRGYTKRSLRAIKHSIKLNRLDAFEINPNGAFPCNGPNCKKCQFISPGPTTTINGKSFLINTKLTCNSHSVIYVITCVKCSIHYIGQTMNPLRSRLGQHLSDIRLNKPTSVATHFNNHNEDPLVHFRIIPIFFMPDLDRRRALEMKFIKKFNTLSPIGLNDRFDPYNVDDNILPIIIPFSLTSDSFVKGIKNLASNLNVTDSKIITAYKRHRNLKEILNNKF